MALEFDWFRAVIYSLTALAKIKINFRSFCSLLSLREIESSYYELQASYLCQTNANYPV